MAGALAICAAAGATSAALPLAPPAPRRLLHYPPGHLQLQPQLRPTPRRPIAGRVVRGGGRARARNDINSAAELNEEVGPSYYCQSRQCCLNCAVGGDFPSCCWAAPWSGGRRSVRRAVLLKCRAAPKNKREFDDFIDPAKQEPPEAGNASDERLTQWDKVGREAERVRKSQEEEYTRTKPIFLKAVGIDPNEYKGPPDVDGEQGEEEEETGGGRRAEGVRGVLQEVNELGLERGTEDDDFYSMLDRAVANLKRPAAESGKLAKKNGKGRVAANAVGEEADEEAEVLSDEEVGEYQAAEAEAEAELEDSGDLEADEQKFLEDVEQEEEEEEEEEEVEEVEEGEEGAEDVNEETAFEREFEGVNGLGLKLNDELQEDGEEEEEEPYYGVALSELLDDARVKPLAVDGDLDVEVTGIQHDSRKLSPGDIFVCCQGSNSDGHQFASEAVEKGASVLVVSKEVTLTKGSSSISAMVVVEDTNAVLSALAASFYGHPSQKLAVVGITGTNGKTTTSTLVRSIYETMGLRTGMLGTIGYYIKGGAISNNNKLDAPNTTPDAVYLQELMAKMVHSGTEACVMEVSSHALVQDRCKEVDFDVAVFTNLSRDHMDFHASEDEYKAAKGKLFAKMVDPKKHRKVVNIDDPMAPFFASQGNAGVPVVTFALENTDADVHPLEVQLSLFETELLVKTPKGNIEISSGLLGRHNVYNILAAVAVGVAIESPLEHIVRGIEEVDAVPGRCELIDEEQAFAVIVDYAHTPDALARLLDTVRECGAQRIITVVGCGGDRDKGKRPLMAKIATDRSDVCIFTSDNPRTEEPLDILDDMLAGVGWSMAEYLKWGENDYYPALPNGHRLFVYDIRTIAVRAGVAMGEEGDAVVIAGKGHETYQIVGTKEEYFDDREECREALQHLDELHAAGVDTSEFPWRVLESG